MNRIAYTIGRPMWSCVWFISVKIPSFSKTCWNIFKNNELFNAWKELRKNKSVSNRLSQTTSGVKMTEENPEKKWHREFKSSYNKVEFLFKDLQNYVNHRLPQYLSNKKPGSRENREIIDFNSQRTYDRLDNPTFVQGLGCKWTIKDIIKYSFVIPQETKFKIHLVNLNKKEILSIKDFLKLVNGLSVNDMLSYQLYFETHYVKQKQKYLTDDKSIQASKVDRTNPNYPGYKYGSFKICQIILPKEYADFQVEYHKDFCPICWHNTRFPAMAIGQRSSAKQHWVPKTINCFNNSRNLKPENNEE